MTIPAKRGRKPFEPTEKDRELVQQLVAFGTPQEQICTLIKGANGRPISKPTLLRHFRTELDQGAVVANVKVAQNLYRIATGNGGGAVTAAIFWLKTRAGWRDNVATFGAGDGEDDIPLSVEVRVVDARKKQNGKATGEDQPDT